MYPALAVLQTLKVETEDVLWVGGHGGMEADLITRAGLPFLSIPAAGVHGVGLRALPGNIWRLLRGYAAAKRLINEFNPDVLFFTGGYVAVPVALAGRRLPILIFVPDIEPGLALKTLARFADRIAVSTDESRKYYPKDDRRVVVSGYPVREELSSINVKDAYLTLGLTSDLPILLVFGGSLGARSINRALMNVLPQLLDEMQIIHITGELDWGAVSRYRDKLSENHAARYRTYPYVHHEMGAMLQVADLVLSRAGASTLGEFPLFNLPAILVPYPHAWRYQRINAEFLARQGAAIVIDDQELQDRILPMVQDLIRDRERREKMKSAMKSLAQPNAAESIGQLLLDLAGHKGVH